MNTNTNFSFKSFFKIGYVNTNVKFSPYSFFFNYTFYSLLNSKHIRKIPTYTYKN